MSLDLTPAAGAASRVRRIIAHARTEAVLTARNGEQALLNLVIPLGALIAGRLAGDRLGLDATTWPASVMALALWSTFFTSLAINTAFERRYGVLERLVSTPLSKADLLAGKALAAGGLGLVQLVVLKAVALALGWRPPFSAVGTALALPCLMCAGVTFASLAMIMAGRLRAEATLALANLVYMIAAVGTALVLPLTSYPTGIQPLLAALPFAALGEALRGAAEGRVLLWPLPVLAAWAVVTSLLARKAFRWTS